MYPFDPRHRVACPRGQGLHGLSALSAPLGLTVRRLTIARVDQFFLKLQPLVVFALRRQIFYQGIALGRCECMAFIRS
jgi:hypothetical protein